MSALVSTARPGVTEPTAIEFRANALLRIGEDLVPDQDRDIACACGLAMAGSGRRTHALVCGALWHTVDMKR